MGETLLMARPGYIERSLYALAIRECFNYCEVSPERLETVFSRVDLFA
jgi:hypothetical protein